MKHMPWRRSLWIWNAAGRPCGEETKETMKRRRKDGDKAEDADRGEANVRSELGEGGIGVPACAWVHLYGGATRRAGGELAGAPIWRSRQVFFFSPLPVGAGAPIWGSHSQELGNSTAIRIGMWHDKSTKKGGLAGGGWQVHLYGEGGPPTAPPSCPFPTHFILCPHRFSTFSPRSPSYLS